MKNTIFGRACAAMVGTLLLAGGAKGQTIYNLGTLGGEYSAGYAVNASGQVAGRSYPPGNGVVHAFRYDGAPSAGGVMWDLGALGGTRGSQGFAINASGQVVGDSWTANDAAYHAFRYDGTPGAGGIMRDLGTLGGSASYGGDINASGQITGSSDTGGNGVHAFLYDGTPGAGGIMYDLGTLGGESRGRAINASWQVAGYSAGHAFRYDGTPSAGGVMRDLGTLGGIYSDAHSINASGQVAGTSLMALVGGPEHAFRYDGTPGAGGVMRDLGTLGGTNSNGIAINASGQVAGTSYPTGSTNSHAFLYIGTPGAGGQMLDLDVWLDANNPAEGAKWTLDAAADLSDNGWITGTGQYDDGPDGLNDGARAFLLDARALVPEPSGLGLLSVGVGVLLRRRTHPTARLHF